MEQELDSIEFELKLRLAHSIAEGYSYKELMKTYALSHSQLRRYRKDPGFQEMVSDIVEDNRTSAYYRLIASSNLAVKELVSFLGNGELSDREQLAAINMILSLTLETDKKSRDSVTATQIKGYARKNIQDIKDAMIGKPKAV